MQMYFSRVLSIVAILVFSLQAIPVFAQQQPTQSQEIQYETVNPGSPYYIFKRLQETVALNLLTFGEKNKEHYHKHLLGIRFRELEYAVNNKQLGYIENVADRYTNQLGIILEKYPGEDSSFQKQVEVYLPVLSKLRDEFPANSPYWLILQYSVDTTNRAVKNQH